MIDFQNGNTPTTQIGYVNRNKQKCLGHRGKPGNDYNQKAYKMECLCCEYTYGANGSDAFQRLCPKCQSGQPGIEF